MVNNDNGIRSFLSPASVTNDGKTIEGIAIKFDSLSEDLGGFREIIKREAVTEALKANVRALIEHDLKKFLGSTKDGTVTLDTRNDGVHFKIELPDTSYVNDLRAAMRANPTSFGASFRMVGKVVDKWLKSAKDGVIRIVEKIPSIPEITITAFPAYTATSAQLRSIDASQLVYENASQASLDYVAALLLEVE